MPTPTLTSFSAQEAASRKSELRGSRGARARHKVKGLAWG